MHATGCFLPSPEIAAHVLPLYPHHIKLDLLAPPDSILVTTLGCAICRAVRDSSLQQRNGAARWLTCVPLAAAMAARRPASNPVSARARASLADSLTQPSQMAICFMSLVRACQQQLCSSCQLYGMAFVVRSRDWHMTMVLLACYVTAEREFKARNQ